MSLTSQEAVVLARHELQVISDRLETIERARSSLSKSLRLATSQQEQEKYITKLTTYRRELDIINRARSHWRAILETSRGSLIDSQ